ncbi:hypothetical protein QFC22_005143 [Naganishia vaughanmartiniae]|uniref:Uncharacterized protein n=1 Tax=Naganishia vaughanmartiniae TaxID=1424756 RepID=A0ACC2WUC8_9TREE|nr:hypothetical protein QFC22_005143 [Naganishia vaughanmartiniae]
MSPSLEDDYTAYVASHSGPKANPRAKVIFSSLIKHLHAFAREVELTNDEWLAACEGMIAAGKISGTERNEMILISDVLGLEALLDTMAHDRFLASQSPHQPSKPTHSDNGHTTGKETESSTTGGLEAVTLSAILGPFYRTAAPEYENGQSMVVTHHPEDVSALVHGVVKRVDGKPIQGAKVEIWHTGTEGLYDSQLYDPKEPSKHPFFNWRGVYRTDEQGRYACRALKPTAYPIPYDSTAGEILKALDRSPMRPAHIHFLVTAPGYRSLITQIYDGDCEYVKSDSVFGVKDGLVVKFVPVKEEGKDTDVELEYDIVLMPDES